MSFSPASPASEALNVLSGFRVEFYESLYARAEVLFELTDAMLCTDGPVKTLVELSLAHEMRRGHGAVYAALDKGWCELARMRLLLTHEFSHVDLRAAGRQIEAFDRDSVG